MDSLHSRIKTSRIDMGLSQAQLAAQAGVTQPTIANWENGSHIPRQKALGRISDALNVEPDWLLSGEYAQAHGSVQAYLRRPIRHVPIYLWTEHEHALMNGHPAGYLPYPIEHEDAFAIVDYSDPSLKNRIRIFDPAPRNRESDYVLWAQHGLCHITVQSEMPDAVNFKGRLKAEIKSF